MTRYALYSSAEVENGAFRIASMASCDEASVALETQDPEESYDRYAEVGPSVRDDSHYIDAATGNARPRPKTPCIASATTVAADGESTITLADMADDTQIAIAGPVPDALTVSGSVELTFTRPGQYTITATAPFPARPREITIDAT